MRVLTMDNFLGRNLGRNLVAFRTAEGNSKEEFGARLGVELDYLEGLERGEADPDLGTVETLAARIGMEPLLLLEDTGPRVD